MSNNLNTGHMISKPISSLSGVPIFEVTTWTVPFLHRDHHANPEPCHFILKSSKTVLKPFTDFRYKKRPPKPNHVPCCWKKRDLWLDQLLSWSCWFKKQFFDKTHPRAQPGKAAKPRPALEVIGEALIGNARGTWEDGEDGVQWSGIIPSAPNTDTLLGFGV